MTESVCKRETHTKGWNTDHIQDVRSAELSCTSIVLVEGRQTGNSPRDNEMDDSSVIY